MENKDNNTIELENADTLQKAATTNNEAPIARVVDAEEIPSGYWWWFRFLGSAFSVILLAVCLYIGFSLPASCLAVINADLGPSPIYVFITTAGSLVSGVGILLVGRLGDIIGRRYFLITGQLIGVVSGIISAKATSVNMLIGGSALQGFSSTVQLTFPYVIQELVPNKYRGWAQAVMIAAVLPFAGFGTIIARLLIEHTSLGWRWCYWLNVIFCGVSLVLLICCYFPPNMHQLNRKLTPYKELKELDYVGCFLYGAGLLFLLLGLAWGGAAYSWTSAHVLSTLLIGIVMLIAFALYETFMPLEQPLLPTRILRNRNYIGVVIAGSVGQMVFVGLSVLWPEQIQAIYTTDNVLIGWLSCTSGLALAVGEIIMGPLFKPIGHARWQLIISCAGLTAFLGGMAGTNQHNRTVAIVLTTLTGFCAGWMELIVLVMNGLVNKPQDLGLANGFLGSIRNTAGTIALSIYIAILDRRTAVEIPAHVTQAALGAGLKTTEIPTLLVAVSNGTTAAIDAVPGMTTAIEVSVGNAVKSGYASSFATVYLATIAFGACAVIASLFTSDIDHLLTSQVGRRLRGTIATAGISDDENHKKSANEDM